jgi:hypothetical protein
VTSFVTVNPFTRKVEAVNVDHLHDAQALVGLGNVDHGILVRNYNFALGYVVDEFGLFKPVSEQKYFGLCGQLIAGPSVLYAFDDAGETVNLRRSEIPDVRFYLGVNDVEAAIDRGEIERPFMAVNGVELWHWPQPAPKGMTRDVDK